MNPRNKFFVIIGFCAVIAASSFGGYVLFAGSKNGRSSGPTAIKASNQDELDSLLTRKIEEADPAAEDPKTTNEDQPDPAPAPAPAPTPTPAPAPAPAPKPAPAPAPKPTPAPTPAPAPAPAPTPTYTYKNGTYSASVTYSNNHGSNNTITTTVTVNNDILKSVTDVHSVGDPDSQSFVDDFEASIGSAVNGQKLATISPSRVGGSSLTTNAFNSAIAAIRTKAKA